MPAILSTDGCETGSAAIQGADFEVSHMGADPELRKSEDATHVATDGPAPRRYDGDTPRIVRCVPVFVRSEKSNARR